jgi:short-subunit dehydrogenase
VPVYGEALRDELAGKGVAVNVVCPGFIKTPMTDVNKFPMPFIMTGERAARIIQKGLARNHARIAFPWIMYALVRLAAALPQDWIAGSVAKLPKKPHS